MNVLVDTSVWSQVIRRQKKESKFSGILYQLIENGQVVIIGPIRQELLSGIPDRKQFESLQEKLSYFPDVILETEDYEQAAVFFNRCRANGIQGSHIDFLICSVAYRHDMEILTTDRDFEYFSSVLPITLSNLQ